MKYLIKVNNYVLGAKVKTSPLHKLVSKERIDSKHTELVYENLTANEIQLCESLFARKLKVID